MILSQARARCQLILRRRCRYFRYFSTEASKIRNIGIVAHIDAGKTTVTERILYETGAIRAAGTIKHGNTTTDFLPCEQNRGITVNSAFVQTHWSGHLFNIIDTPGHVDFSFEVERSLRVLDGALVVIDGTRGVEAQTVTVWKQLEKFCVPRLVFLNKLDRGKRDIDLCMSSIRNTLRTVPVLVNHPVYDEDNQLVGVSNTPSSDVLTDTVESLAEVDEVMEDLYFTHDCDPSKIPPLEISESVKRQLHLGKVTPVCVGSGLAGVGIGSCLDFIIQYLPSPLHTVSKLPAGLRDQICGVVFKSSLDPNRGVLCQTRLYSGTLQPRSKVLNVRTKRSYQVSNLFQIDADKVKLQSSCEAGGITMIAGCKDFRTGDVFVAESFASKGGNLDELVESNTTLKSTMTYGKPLFFCTIEATDSISNDRLEKVLTAMTFEDPTLTLKKSQNGELVLGGTGQLHLSVVRERIKDEHGLECKAYKFRVNYMETVSQPIEHFHSGPLGELHLTISPAESGKVVAVENVCPITREVVEPAIASSLTIGPLVGLQLSNCHITASFNLNPPDHNKFPSKEEKRVLNLMVKTAIKQIFKDNQSLMTLCEPFAEIEVEGPQEYSSAIMADFSLRAGSLEYQMSFSKGGDWFSLVGNAPLSKLTDFSSRMRHISRGSASVLRIETVRYGPMELEDCRTIVKMFKDGVL
ncbi:ribosome-releasing factor 2, mitochondrial-like [Bolinopsis microptera]|uniref:ribosome-releasing factor 2, mitochondrial-like n=1 Tax=Bolinopsis microptera TaxID=2820187 RepID=UPI003078E385